MDFILLITAAGLAFALCSRWFWKLAGLAAALVLGLILINLHARLVAYALDLAVAAATVTCIVKAIVWLKGRKRLGELPAETTSYPTSPAYTPSRKHSRIGPD